MGPLRMPRYEGEFSITTSFVTELNMFEVAQHQTSVEFYEDVDPEIVGNIQSRANEILGDDELELIDGYDFRV